MTNYTEILAPIKSRLVHENTWLVTGAAGFIGSHLAEALLSLGQKVVGLDDFSTGREENIKGLSLNMIRGTITDLDTCRKACEGVDYVLHHAALASVPASMKDPIGYHHVNITGFMNILQASRENQIKRVVYASSSAVYGDSEYMPKVEDKIGKFLSPYAATKYINEVWAGLFTRVYGLECVGLRYFNVFGKRQDPNGAYAAVIPKWIDAIKANKLPVIYGDGTATRDFCAVQNVVLANILAATEPEASGRVFNIGCGVETSLKELMTKIYAVFAPDRDVKFIQEAPREGDILHSSASIELARKVMKFEPVVYLQEGLEAMKA